MARAFFALFQEGDDSGGLTIMDCFQSQKVFGGSKILTFLVQSGVDQKTALSILKVAVEYFHCENITNMMMEPLGFHNCCTAS